MGAKKIGLETAKRNVDKASSAIPWANFPMILAVAGATITISAQSASEICSTWYSSGDSKESKYKEDWDNKRRPDFPVLGVLANNYSNLGEFITECLLDGSTTLSSSEINQSEKEKDKVIISTIHSAKGLESDICFVVLQAK